MTCALTSADISSMHCGIMLRCKTSFFTIFREPVYPPFRSSLLSILVVKENLTVDLVFFNLFEVLFCKSPDEFSVCHSVTVEENRIWVQTSLAQAQKVFNAIEVQATLRPLAQAQEVFNAIEVQATLRPLAQAPEVFNAIEVRAAPRPLAHHFVARKPIIALSHSLIKSFQMYCY